MTRHGALALAATLLAASPCGASALETLGSGSSPVAAGIRSAIGADPAVRSATRTAAQPKKRALIIGINDYELEEWRLTGAVTDAANMARFTVETLKVPLDEVGLLLDRDATRANILAAFEQWLIDGTEAGDEIVIYYSGHGSQQEDLNGEEADGLDETIVPADARPTDEGVENMIADDELDRVLSLLADRKVTMMIDACHSGTATRALMPGVFPGQRSLPPVKGRPPEPLPSTRSVQENRKEPAFLEGSPNRTVWSAVAASQVALEDREINPNSGVFTNRFIAGAEGKADANGDGVVSHAELHDYVLRESDAYCARPGACPPSGLTPTLEAHRSMLAQAVVPSAAEPFQPELPPEPEPEPEPEPQPEPQPEPEPQPPPQPEAQPQPTPTPTPDPVDLLAHANPANVTLEVLPADSVRLGQPVQFRVRSDMPGHLLVLDVNAAGQLVQIFPNEYSIRTQKDGMVAGGRPLTIPDATYGFEFTASEPAGKGILVALVLEDPLDLSDITGPNGALEPVTDPAEYLTLLAQRLRKPYTGDTYNRTLRWSMAYRKYSITR